MSIAVNEERFHTGRGTEERVMQSPPALRTRLISRQTELQTAFAPFFLSNIFHTLLPRKLRELPAMPGKGFLPRSPPGQHTPADTHGGTRTRAGHCCTAETLWDVRKALSPLLTGGLSLFRYPGKERFGGSKR